MLDRDIDKLDPKVNNELKDIKPSQHGQQQTDSLNLRKTHCPIKSNYKKTVHLNVKVKDVFINWGTLANLLGVYLR